MPYIAGNHSQICRLLVDIEESGLPLEARRIIVSYGDENLSVLAIAGMSRTEESAIKKARKKLNRIQPESAGKEVNRK
jgi:hypothetical protein|tara:strand:+ start:687 stop:920 length:234 start_codon:yes stop_codon:yes gene_type:complete